MQKEMIIIPNSSDFDIFKKRKINTFLLPLEGYSIGFDKYFNIKEINALAKEYKVYVLMNKFMHKKIEDFKEIIDKFDKNVMFMVEDIGFANIIDRNRIVLYENHITSNYKAVNYLASLNINNVIINNDLTIDELEEISSKVNSELYYFYVSKNMIMYSRRNLVRNYNEHYNINSNDEKYNLKEKISQKILEIKDEDGSTVRYNKIFCASKYIDKLNKYNLIIDLTSINESDTLVILDNINDSNLCEKIDSDYYFLENEIKYKVGDLK